MNMALLQLSPSSKKPKESSLGYIFYLVASLQNTSQLFLTIIFSNESVSRCEETSWIPIHFLYLLFDRFLNSNQYLHYNYPNSRKKYHWTSFV